MSPRAAIEPLALAYAFDAAEVEGVLAFRQRGGEPVAEVVEDDLILPDDGAPAQLVRAQETELPREVSIAFTDSGSDYRRSAVTSRRLVGGAARARSASLAVVTGDTAAERRADIWLDLWAGREAPTRAAAELARACAGRRDRSHGRRAAPRDRAARMVDAGARAVRRDHRSRCIRRAMAAPGEFRRRRRWRRAGRHVEGPGAAPCILPIRGRADLDR
jgi:hypothetical protein